jgi:hypothetical protein
MHAWEESTMTTQPDEEYEPEPEPDWPDDGQDRSA